MSAAELHDVPLLRSRPFLALWGVGALNSTGRWLDMLVIAIFALDRTGSPLVVASMLMMNDWMGFRLCGERGAEPSNATESMFYDLRRGSFRQGWEHYLHHLQRQQITRQTKCIPCGLKSMCGMCPANGELECRDSETPVDFLCRVAHLRAYALDIPIAPHGKCAYCEGGSRYGEMKETAAGLKRSAFPTKP